MCDLTSIQLRLAKISDTLAKTDELTMAVTEQIAKQSVELKESASTQTEDVAFVMASTVSQQLQKIVKIRKQFEQFFMETNKFKDELITMLNALVLSIKTANLRFNSSAFHRETSLYVRLNLVKAAIESTRTDSSIKDDVEKQVYQGLLQDELQRLYSVIERANANVAQFLSTLQQPLFARLAAIRKQVKIEHEIATKAQTAVRSLSIAKRIIPVLQQLGEKAKMADLEITPTPDDSDVGLVFPVFRARPL